MKKIFLYLLIFSIISQNFNLNAQNWSKLDTNNSKNFYDIQKVFNEYWQGKEYRKGNGWKQFKRWEEFWEKRVYPSGEFPNTINLLNAYEDFLRNEHKGNQFLKQNEEWKEAGPISIPVNKLSYQSTGLGRINVLRIHPQNDNVLWVGSSSGGAWKSTNKGQSWQLAKFTDVLSLGVSDIAIAPTKPEVMYIATGDKNGSFMSNSFSIGILKSTNSGETWSLVSQPYTTTDYVLAARILINPTNHNLVYFSSSRGIFRTKDGGKNWENVYQAYSLVYDMEFRPDNPEVIYASSNGKILRSTNGGDTWSQIFTFSGASRIELAVSIADPNYVYAVGAKNSSGAFAGVVKSTDGGNTFSYVSTTPNILSIDVNGNEATGQGTYDLDIVVSPKDKDLVFVGGIHTWKSIDGAKTWKLLNHWTGSYSLPYVHADQHNLIINPNNSELYNTNDGGVYITSDNGVKWKDISNGLAVTQFYKINVSPANNEMIIGGTQDNGTLLFKGGFWAQVNGGDGMDCAIDPIDDKYVYSTTQYGNLYRSTTGGYGFTRVVGPDLFQNEQANWVTPVALNPINPASIYIGYKNVYKSTNRGNTWIKLTNLTSAPIRQLKISEKDTNVIYISINASLYKSVDGGATFTTIKTFTNMISGLVCDPTNENRVFVALSGYNAKEKVYEILGNQAKNITYNLPNISFSAIEIQKNTSGRLFIGSDIGVFLKNDDFSNKWETYSENLPPTVVNDLKINYSTGKLYAGTFGRGAWETKLFDCNIEKPKIKVIGNTEFCTGDSVRLEAVSKYKQFRWSTGDTTKSVVITTTGIYFVSVKDEKGCTEKSESIQVSELYVPPFTIRTNKEMVLCGQDTIILSTPIGFNNYLWSTGATTNKITVFKPGIYKITAESKNGCKVKDSVYIPSRPIPHKPNIYVNGDTLSTDSAHSYKWFFNDKEIPNSNTQSIVANKSGEYFVMIFNEYQCSNNSDVSDIVSNVAIKNYEKGFVISPNPFDDYVHIIPKSNYENIEISISDLLGREIINDKFNNIISGNDILIQLPNLNSGLYFVIIKMKDKIYSYNIRKIN